MWLWGAGALPTSTRAAPDAVLGDDERLVACAHVPGVRHVLDVNELAAVLRARPGRVLLLLSVEQSAPEAFVKRVLQPLAAALATGALDRAVVHAAQARQLVMSVRNRWRWWQWT